MAHLTGIIIFSKVTFSSHHLNFMVLEYAMGIFYGRLDWLMSRHATAFIASAYIIGLRSVNYMRWCIYCLLPPIIGNGDEETNWCCWLVTGCCLLVRMKREFSAAGWRYLVVVVCLKLIVWHPCVNFHLCGFSLLLSALAGVHKTVIFAGENSILNLGKRFKSN